MSRSIVNLDPGIRFAGVMEKSGHLYAEAKREGISDLLTGRNLEISLSQSAYIVDLRKMFSSELGTLQSVVYTYGKVKLISMPVKDHLLVLSSEINVNSDNLVAKISDYINSIQADLSLYPPGNIVNSEKKEILRNLHDSGISEELIAEQLDLNVDTVKILIQEIK